MLFNEILLLYYLIFIGFMIRDYLKGSRNAVEFLKSIEPDNGEYNGFNLVLLEKVLAYNTLLTLYTCMCTHTHTHTHTHIYI